MNRQNLRLHGAVKADDMPQVRLLLEQGAELDERDVCGMTPLHVAATLESPECIRVLLDAGADRDACEQSGMTPLVIAAWYGRVEVTRLLLERSVGADAIDLQRAMRMATFENGEAVIPALEEFGAKIGLIEAMYLGDEAAVRRFLAEGSDVNQLDDGSTLLMHAIAAYLGRLTHNFVPLLLASGACPNMPCADGSTPLMMASNWGMTAVMNALLAAGADPHILGPHGETALSLARRDPEHNAQAIERLLQVMADERVRMSVGASTETTPSR